ncbi:hypothetical protein BRADI_1g14971v3 [Brachypodium distachyon]|uniref:Serine-threonine/tyrosine-protein kinase catalytic domain-containing protein n=1 Tax=Brachypodium distachyon TaxID=15368 RepID=A0A0Q3GV50_BRADI|nr:hypothetical protein BRADI_1g14971v3 [Brachypodium distachyon]
MGGLRLIGARQCGVFCFIGKDLSLGIASPRRYLPMSRMSAPPCSSVVANTAPTTGLTSSSTRFWRTCLTAAACLRAPCSRAITPPLLGRTSGQRRLRHRQAGPGVTYRFNTFLEGHILEAPNLRTFTFLDLGTVTKNFRLDSVLELHNNQGYTKGGVDENTMNPAKSVTGMVVAVKKLNLESMHLYVKSDVYGFGVVMLETLTGQCALDPNRPSDLRSDSSCFTRWPAT